MLICLRVYRIQVIPDEIVYRDVVEVSENNQALNVGIRFAILPVGNGLA